MSACSRQPFYCVGGETGFWGDWIGVWFGLGRGATEVVVMCRCKYMMLTWMEGKGLRRGCGIVEVEVEVET